MVELNFCLIHKHALVHKPTSTALKPLTPSKRIYFGLPTGIFVQVTETAISGSRCKDDPGSSSLCTLFNANKLN